MKFLQKFFFASTKSNFPTILTHKDSLIIHILNPFGQGSDIRSVYSRFTQRGLHSLHSVNINNIPIQNFKKENGDRSTIKYLNKSILRFYQTINKNMSIYYYSDHLDYIMEYFQQQFDLDSGSRP